MSNKKIFFKKGTELYVVKRYFLDSSSFPCVARYVELFCKDLIFWSKAKLSKHYSTFRSCYTPLEKFFFTISCILECHFKFHLLRLVHLFSFKKATPFRNILLYWHQTNKKWRVKSRSLLKNFTRGKPAGYSCEALTVGSLRAYFSRGVSSDHYGATFGACF